MQELIKKQVKDSIEVKELILHDDDLLNSIRKAAEICIFSLRNGNKIMTAGNGGSAADAQHLSAELVNRFGFERPGLSSIALTTDSSVLTSIANDSDFDKIFSRQIEALGKTGDVLVAISTSGKSANIINGIARAKEMNLKVIGLTGRNGGRITGKCDVLLSVPSDLTPRIQEAHGLIIHILCLLIENELYGKS
jgi:D-sedoheptulose 7-phosphate isomerase